MTSIFAGFVIFSYVGYMAGELNVQVDHVADEGKRNSILVKSVFNTKIAA